VEQAPRPPVTRIKTFDDEYRAGKGYDQEATPYMSVGVIAAATGDTSSKYVARRETPHYIPENCTQCMECIAVCRTRRSRTARRTSRRSSGRRSSTT
jgi:pyruvate-ferredoxin/flavodoxin oxidoreductase